MHTPAMQTSRESVLLSALESTLLKQHNAQFPLQETTHTPEPVGGEKHGSSEHTSEFELENPERQNAEPTREETPQHPEPLGEEHHESANAAAAEPSLSSEGGWLPPHEGWIEQPKPRGRPFQVGNTIGRGRPKGSRNRITTDAQDILEQNASAIAWQCAHLAMKGDRAALRICMERLYPVAKHMPVSFEMPPIRNNAEMNVAYQALLHAIGNSELSPSDGQQLLPILDRIRGTLPKPRNSAGPTAHSPALDEVDHFHLDDLEEPYFEKC